MPTGTVTFLMTDVEGSTRVGAVGEAMAVAIPVIRDLVWLYSGTTVPVPVLRIVTVGSPRYRIVPVPVSVASSVDVA